MSDPNNTQDVDVLTQVISLLNQVSPEDRERIMHAVATFLQIKPPAITRAGTAPLTPRVPVAFSEDLAASPKEFLLERQPKTDVERVACLAYYLTHYRDTPHFKTLDISKLNTEAAQPKFSNPAWPLDNAVKRGYLVQASRGNRQLSAFGERFVQALPDREAAKVVMESVRTRKRVQKKKKSKDSDQ